MKTFATIITRILFFPFILGIAIIAVTTLFLKYMANYMQYGGEAITYTHKTQRKTINDVFNKLIENENKTKV